MPNKNPSKKGYVKVLSEAWDFIGDVFYNIVVIVLLVVLIRSFVISPFRVVGSSMADTLENNEFIIIDKLSYVIGEPDRGDPIVFLPPVTNRYLDKFSEEVKTNENGEATMEISGFSGYKNVSYCQKKITRMLWICNEKVRTGDIIYVVQKGQTESQTESGKGVTKMQVTKEDIKRGHVSIQGEPSTEYQALIYNNAGDEYFVKRVIGTPGDTVRIEGGRVFLKKVGSADFRELNESYLNSENLYDTKCPLCDEGNEFLVPEGHYFTLGDNRNHSNDSRSWVSPVDQIHSPFVPEDQISGKVAVVLWPITGLRLIGGADL